MASSTLAPVRIGCVQYLNTLPLIQGLSAWADAELTPAVPARLIDMLLGGQIDLGLVSLIDYARSPEPLVLIPAGMIGCDGPTLTVRLFSAVEPERIRQLHADTESHTSVALARRVLAERYGRSDIELVNFDARSLRAGGGGTHWPEALLLIGDKVVTDAPPADRYPHQVDLGEAWKALTALPFVYAVWMCRAAAWDAGDELAVRLRAAAAVLDRARRHNRTRADWLIAAGAGPRGWPDELARRYAGEYLRYEVTDREREAVERFLGEAAGMGLCPERTVRWAEL